MLFYSGTLGGFTYFIKIKGLLHGVEVLTGVDFLTDHDYWLARGRRIVYTGMTDQLMDYSLGALGYRSLEFETLHINVPDYQGTAVVNETGADVPYTRTIEQKHFAPLTNVPHTIITREYPRTWHKGAEAYYPINDDRNNRLYAEYRRMASAQYPTISFGGRLGSYRYYDMDDAVEAALAFDFQ